MDKLRPLIIYRFWIILVVVLLLPPIGWWMASGKLKAEIDKRVSDLTSLKSGIPSGQGAPNDDWFNQAQKLVDVRKIRNELALKVLWDAQVKTRVWPASIAKYMGECPYRGEISDRSKRERIPDLYRDAYDRELARIWQIPFPRQDMSDPNRPKVVDFPINRLPRVPALTWRGIAPTWPEIWNSSEDFWLLEQLMQSVQRTNAYATSLTDANVKQIEVVELFGGKRLGPTEASTTTASTGGPGSAPAGYPGGMPPGGGPGGIGGAAATAVTSAEFNVGEEYQVTPTRGATMGGADMMGGSAPGAVAATPGAAANPNEGRYIQDTPAFRTRGFRIKVIVRQQNAMELVRELLNSQYPVEIVRVQQFVLNPAFGMSSGAGGGFGGGLGGGSFPGFPMPMGIEGGSGGGTLGFEGGAALTPTDPLAGAALGGESAGAVSGASPQDSLVYQDPHLVSLVILGEMYIYNEPKLPETPAGAASDPNATTPVQPMGDPAGDPSSAAPASNVAAPAVSEGAPMPAPAGATSEAPVGTATPAGPAGTGDSPSNAGGATNPPAAQASPPTAN